jgi:hypothetical protein
MTFICRFGNSCGIAFEKDVFFKKHRQWQKFEPYIKDRPSQSWTEFTITNDNSNKEKTKTKSKFKLTRKRNRQANNKSKNMFRKIDKERT